MLKMVKMWLQVVASMDLISTAPHSFISPQHIRVPALSAAAELGLLPPITLVIGNIAELFCSVCWTVWSAPALLFVGFRLLKLTKYRHRPKWPLEFWAKTSCFSWSLFALPSPAKCFFLVLSAAYCNWNKYMKECGFYQDYCQPEVSFCDALFL